MTEGKALRELKRGNEEALCWFIDTYTPYVTTIIYNIIGSSMDAADIEETASDVFLAFWQNAQKVRPLSVRGYLGTIARNLAKNKLRQLRNDLPLDEDILIVDEISPEIQVEQQELSRAVRRAILEMDHPQREIFLRFYYYGQKTDEIAVQMQMNPSTVRCKLSRGREDLKKTLIRYLT